MKPVPEEIREGSVQIFTFKTGLLSRVAHDLQLRVEGFAIQVDGDEIVGRFRPVSITVDGVIRRGQLDLHALSDRDQAEILDNIRTTILQTTRHPEVVVRGTIVAASSGWRVDGTLELKGTKQPLVILVRREGARARGEVEIVPSRWGIPPFRALLGAIQLQDRVKIAFDLPAFADLP